MIASFYQQSNTLTQYYPMPFENYHFLITQLTDELSLNIQIYHHISLHF